MKASTRRGSVTIWITSWMEQRCIFTDHSVLDVEKKARKAKHIDHYVGPATIVKKIGSRSFQISFTKPLTGVTQLLQWDAGMSILKKE